MGPLDNIMSRPSQPLHVLGTSELGDVPVVLMCQWVDEDPLYMALYDDEDRPFLFAFNTLYRLVDERVPDDASESEVLEVRRLVLSYVFGIDPDEFYTLAYRSIIMPRGWKYE